MSADLLLIAMELLERGDATGALAVLERARPASDDDSNLHLLLGRCHETREDWPRAEIAYRRSLELRPDAAVCLFHCVVLDRLGRDDESIAGLHRALEIDPAYEEAHYNLGHLAQRGGDLDAAAARFRRAIELDPDYAEAHASLGRLLLQRALQAPHAVTDPDWQRAHDHLTRAAALDPHDTHVRDSLAAMAVVVERSR